MSSTMSGVARQQVRCFSSSASSSKAVLSPLHKTTLARLKRRERQSAAGSDARQTKDASRMTIAEAGKVLQALSPTTPNAAYEINIQLKPSSTVQLNALRGRVFLPHAAFSPSKSEQLVVFASGQAALDAKQAGADIVGGEELIQELLNGTLSPDKLIAAPNMAGLFTRNPTLARLLGPKGLMPSVKRGTVAEDMTKAVREARGGLDWKGDARGVVRAG